MMTKESTILTLLIFACIMMLAVAGISQTIRINKMVEINSLQGQVLGEIIKTQTSQLEFNSLIIEKL